MSSADHYVLKLYIAGESALAQTAIHNFKRLLRAWPNDDISSEIVDVFEDPSSAERDRVLATPLLVKVAPPPIRKVIGDLQDTREVFSALGVRPAEPGSNGNGPPSPPA